MITRLITRLSDKLFLRMANKRGVTPIVTAELVRAAKAANNNLTFLAVSGALNDGTTPSALRRHAVRKLSHNSTVTLQALVQGSFKVRDN